MIKLLKVVLIGHIECLNLLKIVSSHLAEYLVGDLANYLLFIAVVLGHR